MMKIIKMIMSWLCRQVPHRKRQSSSSEKIRIARGIRQFFEQHYELRYNVMKQVEEFRPLEQKTAVNARKALTISEMAAVNFDKVPLLWRQLTDRELRRIAIEQMEQVGVAWSVDVELYARSAFVPDYNPVEEFLSHCGEWDGHEDHIRRLAQRIPTDYAAWPDLFYRWMLAMVAQWMNLSHDYGNAVVPVLIGSQGVRKSTFCRLLLPPELREYYIDDIKLDNGEQVERMLSRMLLVNIDEYNAKTPREQAKIKRILTEKNVQTRRMRSDQYELRHRMASFIATTNDREPLTDPTGSRRYPCCEIRGFIDTDTPIDYQQLYGQAVTELRQGTRWYFSKEEEVEMERHNQQYRCQSSPETILQSFFEPATPCKENFIRAVDIQEELRLHVRAADVPTIKALTTALKACHFSHGKVNGQRGWYAQRQ